MPASRAQRNAIQRNYQRSQRVASAKGIESRIRSLDDNWVEVGEVTPPPAHFTSIRDIRVNPRGGKVFATQKEARAYQLSLRALPHEKKTDYFICIIGRDRYRVSRNDVSDKGVRHFLNYM